MLGFIHLNRASRVLAYAQKAGGTPIHVLEQLSNRLIRIASILMFSKTLHTGFVSSAKQYDCLLYVPLRDGHKYLRFKQYLRHRGGVRRLASHVGICASSPMGVCASSPDITAPLYPSRHRLP